jgi:hypothetical protein
MPRRYVFLLATSALVVVALALGQPALFVVAVPLMFAVWSVTRDIIANPRLELEPQIWWIVGVFLAFPIAVPLYVFRHGMPWRRATEPGPGKTPRAPIWPPSSSG